MSESMFNKTYIAVTRDGHEVYLKDTDGPLVVVFEPYEGGEKADYHFSQLVMSVLKEKDFPVCTTEGEFMYFVSLEDLRKICLRIVYTVEPSGDLSMVFENHDLTIPF